ncbi:protocadherin Fat 4-like [Dreissena polymorpha]|uniref:protocadherin Fat 4-like n=1 Tax=Dreissena polymorpha TaxID=45954 RepID=UPI0022645539|nr:protocadherin Fat 4-like [Dreissena polymorpha]
MPIVRVLNGATGTSVGSTKDFTGATIVSDKRYSINADISGPASPVFGSVSYISSDTIPETTVGGVAIGKVTFNDADSLSLTAITMATNSYFKLVDNGDGTADVNTTTNVATYPISDLAGTSVTLTFTATDPCGATATGTMNISIQNNRPTLTGLAPGVTTSETVDTERSIANYTCSDSLHDIAGSITVAPTSTPAFFISRFLSGTSKNAVYEIVIPAQTATNRFNYDLVNSYTIVVKCSDSKPSGTASATIVVSLSPNKPPQITNLPSATSLNVSQTKLNGDVIFTVLYSESDPDDTVDFTWTCSPTGCPLTVLASGEIQLTDDMVDANANAYNVIITPRDSRNNAGNPRTLTIKVTDFNIVPAFTNLPASIPLNENIVIGSTVVTVSFSDGNAADNHTFTLGTSPYFQMVDPSSGVITTKATINYEALGGVFLYPIRVTVSDGTATSTSTVTFVINNVNEPLEWNAAIYQTDIAEGSPVGSTVPDPGFAITDEDVGDTYKCYMNCGALAGYFTMTTACVIKVTSVYSLDAGLTSPVVCNLTAVDTGAHTATATLTITIDDANNYSPALSQSYYGFTVSGYAGSGTTVGTVNAVDADTGAFGTFTYFLNTSALPGNYFTVDGVTGVVSTVVDMATTCRCSSTSFTMPLTVTDAGGRSGSAQVIIYVSEATTTTTTTTTARFKKFFDDSRNIAWFSVAMILLAVIAVVTPYVMIRYVCMGPSLCRNPLQPRPRFSEQIRNHSNGSAKSTVPHVEKQVPTVRHPPPPKEMQSWRTQRLY